MVSFVEIFVIEDRMARTGPEARDRSSQATCNGVERRCHGLGPPLRMSAIIGIDPVSGIGRSADAWGFLRLPARFLRANSVQLIARSE